MSTQRNPSLIIHHPEAPIVFGDINSIDGHHYQPLPTQGDRHFFEGRWHVPSLDAIPVLEKWNPWKIWSVILSPKNIATVEQKSEYQRLSSEIKKLTKNLEKYTKDKAQEAFHSQPIDDPTKIRTVGDWEHSFQVISAKVSGHRSDLEVKRANILKDCNSLYLSKLKKSKINIEDYIRKQCEAGLAVNLPQGQVDRLVSIWKKSIDATEKWLEQSLLGDEAEIFGFVDE